MSLLKRASAWLLCAALAIAPVHAQSGLGMMGVSNPSVSAGCSYDVSTCALIAAMNVAPSPTRATLYNNLIVGEKSDGVWPLCNTEYLFAAGETQSAVNAQQAASLNIIAPTGAYNGIAVNSPVFANDQGFKGAATRYVDTNFNPTLDTSNYAQNSAALGEWSLSSGTFGGAAIGAKTATFAAYDLWPRFTDMHLYASLNSAALVNVIGSQSDGSGWRMTTRTASTGFTVYSAASVLATPTDTSQALVSSNVIFVNTNGGSQPYAGIVAAGTICSGLTGTQEAALYARIHAYLQAVAGVP